MGAPTLLLVADAAAGRRPPVLVQLAPDGVMGESLDLSAETLTVERFDRADDSSVQHFASLMKQAAVGHFVGQRVLEGVLEVADGGLLLYCDHYVEPDSDRHSALFLERQDQPTALRESGFSGIQMLLDESGMALYAAENSN